LPNNLNYSYIYDYTNTDSYVYTYKHAHTFHGYPPVGKYINTPITLLMFQINPLDTLYNFIFITKIQ